jgi:hypothetical protein
MTEATTTEPTDLRLNDCGVYVRGVDTIDVPMPPKCEARILVVVARGGWVSEFETRGPDGGHGGYPSLTSEVHSSFSAAIVAASDWHNRSLSIQ